MRKSALSATATSSAGARPRYARRQIITRGKAPATCLAWEARNASGLAIHFGISSELRASLNLGWTVTHVASGLSIVRGLPTLAAAVDALNRLAPLGKWTLGARTLFRQHGFPTPAIAETVNDLIREYDLPMAPIALSRSTWSASNP